MSSFNKVQNAAPVAPTNMPAIDRTGVGFLRPAKWRVRALFTAALLVIALGAFLYMQGLFFLGIALITVCLATLAILAIVLHVSIGRFFGPQETHYSKSPLGRYLSADAETIAQETPSLTDEEVAAIDLHRATEAVLVNEWVVNARTPRRIQVRSDDGTALVGRMIPGTKRLRPWVLMLHGHGGTWRDCLAFSRIYAAHDCNIMMVDMRAHGESEGQWTGLGWLDRRDVIAWCSWITARTGEEAQIIIHGLGMGATAALFAAEESDFPAQVRAIVSDSAYTDTWNEAALHMPAGFAKPQPALDFYRYALSKAKGGYDIAAANTLPALQAATTPLFIMQGEEDTFTPPYMGLYLAEAAGCNIEALVDAIAAKETMQEVSQLKAEAAFAAEQVAQAAAEAAEKAQAKTQSGAMGAEEGNESSPAENSNEPSEEAAESTEEEPSAQAQNEETVPLSALEIAQELSISEESSNAEPETENSAEENEEATNAWVALAEGTDEEPASDEPEEEAFAEYPEDDLSDLFIDTPAAEEVPNVQEASPHMAWSATGNVFFYAPAAGHCQASFACPTAYENALNEFLNRCIG